jgi:hypothetical protein
MPENVLSSTSVVVYTKAEVDALLAGLPAGGGVDVEVVQDAVAAMLAQGTGIALSYDDAANTLTVSSDGTSGGLDAEAVRDAIGVALVGVPPVTVTVNDAADTITISSTAYSKPSGGIPKTDLAAVVQTSLGKADTALQTLPPDVPKFMVWNGTTWVALTSRSTVFIGGPTAPPSTLAKDGDLWVS